MIGELAYKIVFAQKFAFSTGYKGMFANSDFEISNILSDYTKYNYKSYNENDYFYGELSGIISNKFSFRASIGETFIKNENGDKNYTNWLFTPQLVLNYAISQTQRMTLKFKSKPRIPSISQLSNNAELVIPYVLRTGNPELKNSDFYKADLEYSLNSKLFNLDFQFYYEHEHNAFSAYYIPNKYNGEGYIFSVSQNAKYFKDYGLYYNISYNPFEKINLKLNIYGYLEQQELKSDIIGYQTRFYAPLYYYIEYSVGKFEIDYNGNIPGKTISGSWTISDENTSHLFMSYKFNNNIKLSAGCFWMFTKSKYEGETFPSSILNYQKNTHIDDNKSMFVLGLAWNFSKGKTINVKQKLHNKDNDQGSF